MSVFDYFSPKKCPNCEKLKEEISVLIEAQRMKKFVSESVRIVSDEKPIAENPISINPGCVLLCSYKGFETPCEENLRKVFQNLNDFYVFISRQIRPFNGSIERFNLFEVTIFFFGEVYQENSYKAVFQILKESQNSQFRKALSLFSFQDNFVQGVLGDPELRLDYTSLGNSLFEIERILMDLKGFERNFIIIPDKDRESFIKVIPDLKSSDLTTNSKIKCHQYFIE